MLRSEIADPQAMVRGLREQVAREEPTDCNAARERANTKE
jgi:hypothetical protein